MDPGGEYKKQTRFEFKFFPSKSNSVFFLHIIGGLARTRIRIRSHALTSQLNTFYFAQKKNK